MESEMQPIYQVFRTVHLGGKPVSPIAARSTRSSAGPA
jgi:hypothetical protein